MPRPKDVRPFCSGSRFIIHTVAFRGAFDSLSKLLTREVRTTMENCAGGWLVDRKVLPSFAVLQDPAINPRDSSSEGLSKVTGKVSLFTIFADKICNFVDLVRGRKLG